MIEPDGREAGALGAPSPLRAGHMGRAFDATAASYKYFWFLALLRLLPHQASLAVREVAREMIVIAWLPAAFYRLSFGFHDRLQEAVRDLQREMRLRPNASEARVRKALQAWPDAPLRVEALSQLVPTRFLGPWVELDLHTSIRDDRRTRAIIKRAAATIDQADGPPYAIIKRADGQHLVFGPGWRTWLLDNQLVLKGYAEYELARFLQARNPHVPGITEKVRGPTIRKLASARRLFEMLRRETGRLIEPYSGGVLGPAFAIDHILPRAFLAHDLLWNLAPTTAAINLAKSEALPAPDLLVALAGFHHEVVRHCDPASKELDDYAAAFGLDGPAIKALGRGAFVELYVQLLSPLLQIATSQGFRSGWIPPPYMAETADGADVKKDEVR